METLREYVSLFGILTAFIILPHANWEFWFAGREDEWYGEIALVGEQGVYILAKNAGEVPVQLRVKPVEHLASVSVGDRQEIVGADAPQVLSVSYGLFGLDRKAWLRRGKRALAGSGRVFEPGELAIATRAESDITIWLLVVAGGMVAGVGASLSVFLVQARASLQDEQQERTQT